MIRLAFSTNAFKKNTLEEAIRAIADAGYHGVEIMADVPHAYPAKFSAEDRRRLKQLLRERDLHVSNVNAFTLFAVGDTYHPTWIESDPDRRRRRIEHTRASIELAAELDCRNVSLQPGGPLIGSNLSTDDAARRFADSLGEVIPAAHKSGVTLAVEPEPGLLIQTSQEYLVFKEQFFVNEKAIAMNCDIGHLFCVGEDPAAVISSMPKEIVHVHLEDIGANRVHQHLAPGKGVIDFAAVFRALNQIAYPGWVTIELYPYETTAQEVAKSAWNHLKALL